MGSEPPRRRSSACHQHGRPAAASPSQFCRRKAAMCLYHDLGILAYHIISHVWEVIRGGSRTPLLVSARDSVLRRCDVPGWNPHHPVMNAAPHLCRYSINNYSQSMRSQPAGIILLPANDRATRVRSEMQQRWRVLRPRVRGLRGAPWICYVNCDVVPPWWCTGCAGSGAAHTRPPLRAHLPPAMHSQPFLFNLSFDGNLCHAVCRTLHLFYCHIHHHPAHERYEHGPCMA
jgi:hypothetical protein